MERFTIGDSRSGKVVTSEPNLDGLETPEEIFDAMAMLDTIAVREDLRRPPASRTNLTTPRVQRMEKLSVNFVVRIMN